MKALDIILAYGKLPLEEQDKVGQILMSNAAMRQALAQAHKDLSDAVSQDDSGEAPRSNVINAVFGTSEPKKRGKKPDPLSAASLLREYLRTVGTGKVNEILAWMHKRNPAVKIGNLYSAATVLAKEGMLTREYGVWSKAA